MAQSVHGYLVVDEYFRPGSVCMRNLLINMKFLHPTRIPLPTAEHRSLLLYIKHNATNLELVK